MRAVGCTLMSTLANLGVAGLMACEVYTPVTVSPTQAGTNVRVTLTDQGTAMLASMLGTSAKQVEGSVSAVSDSTLRLAVTEVTRVDGNQEGWKGEPVTISRNVIATIERKQTSVARSVLVAGAIVGGAMLATRGGTGSQVGPPPVGPPATGH